MRKRELREEDCSTDPDKVCRTTDGAKSQCNTVCVKYFTSYVTSQKFTVFAKNRFEMLIACYTAITTYIWHKEVSLRIKSAWLVLIL